MARNVHLGYNLDEAFAGILHDFAGIVLRVEATVALSVGLHFAPAQHLAVTPGAHFCQARVFLDFNAPALVFGQVPVKAVQLVGRHHVEQFLDFLLAIEVAPLVEHEAPPAEARLIADAHGRQRPLACTASVGLHASHHRARRKQLLEGLQCIEEAGGPCRFDHYPLWGDVQPVGLATHGRVQLQIECRLLGFGARQLQSRSGLELLGKAVEHHGDTVARVVVGSHLGLCLKLENAFGPLHLGRKRNDRQRVLGLARQGAYRPCRDKKLFQFHSMMI